MGRYKVLEAIGEGSFGKVFRGECRDTQRIVALKFIPKHLKGDSELISLRRECEIQRGLFHPNIVLMLDSFETEREVVAVSEYVPQQLCALLQANGALNEVMVRGIACNLVSALYYLHSHRIVHRDIKPQNILLTESGTAKLCDFGFSKKMEINTYVLESIKGTPLYMAPELIEQQPYDQKADLWSLGCILFELLTGTPPFCTNSIVHLIEMVRTKPVQWPTGCSRNCVDFLQGLLQKDQDKRLEWPDVLQHPWVSTGITVVPHNPRIASLTSPLTQSQQQVKEHQKQQLVLRNMGQPNLLPKALSRKYFSEAQVVPDLEAMKLDAPKDNTTGVASASSQLLASILAIMTQILRSDDPSPGVELDGIVRSIIAAAAPVSATEQNSEETALRFLLMSLLTHTAALVRSRCSTLLAHLTSRCSALVSRSLAGQHKVLCDLINLENDPNRSVCKAASFALTRLQQHTTLLKQPA
ncbi:hypothetical protein HAZT_HAZT005426 [Hyalella azteca]|uniref:non-specific serine/threonine protein kinase n=1 Tax=Hyalella azteca TaxID=294128 RepID=A0A6A0H8C9_HYAAZ|nr:hypothetical protein HAZT_HAZT005426 [Hyalella azteca]